MKKKKKHRGLLIYALSGLAMPLLLAAGLMMIISPVVDFANAVIGLFVHQEVHDDELLGILNEDTGVLVGAVKALPFKPEIVNYAVGNDVYVGDLTEYTYHYSGDIIKNGTQEITDYVPEYTPTTTTTYHDGGVAVLSVPDECDNYDTIAFKNPLTGVVQRYMYKCKGHISVGVNVEMKPVTKEEDIYGYWEERAEYYLRDCVEGYGLPWNVILSVATTKFYALDDFSTVEQDFDIVESTGDINEQIYKLKESTVELYTSYFNTYVDFVTDYREIAPDGSYFDSEVWNTYRENSEYYGEENGEWTSYINAEKAVEYPMFVVTGIQNYIWEYEFEYSRTPEGWYNCVSAKRTSRVREFLDNLALCDIDEGDVDLFLFVLENMPGGKVYSEEIYELIYYYEDTGMEYTETLGDGIVMVVTPDESNFIQTN